MTIVVNTRGSYKKETDLFLRQTFLQLIADHPADDFVFVTDQGTCHWVPDAANVEKAELPNYRPYSLLRLFWPRASLPALLNRVGADVLINANGKCCRRTRAKQVLLLTDAEVLKEKVIVGRQKKGRENVTGPWAKSLGKANAVGVFSEEAKKQLDKLSKAPAEKTVVFPLPASEGFSNIGWLRRESVKNKYTQGKEYFLYAGSIQPEHNILNLLKAFSIFKKRQMSNMQLVLAGQLQWPGDNFYAKLDTYKYRADVILQLHPTEAEKQELVAAAYAAINPLEKGGFSAFQLQAMACGVPVISCAASSEPGQEATLPASAADPATLAEQMKTVYKDERLRSDLVAKGYEKAAVYAVSLVAEKLWDCIRNLLPPTHLHLPS